MDATFWALVGLIIFLGIVVYAKVPGMIAGALDKRADQIRNELEEAKRLRAWREQLWDTRPDDARLRILGVRLKDLRRELLQVTRNPADAAGPAVTFVWVATAVGAVCGISGEGAVGCSDID